MTAAVFGTLDAAALAKRLVDEKARETAAAAAEMQARAGSGEGGGAKCGGGSGQECTGPPDSPGPLMTPACPRPECNWAALLHRSCLQVISKGYSSARDLIDTPPAEFDALVAQLKLRPPDGRRLRRSVALLAGTHAPGDAATASPAAPARRA